MCVQVHIIVFAPFYPFLLNVRFIVLYSIFHLFKYYKSYFLCLFQLFIFFICSFWHSFFIVQSGHSQSAPLLTHERSRFVSCKGSLPTDISIPSSTAQCSTHLKHGIAYLRSKYDISYFSSYDKFCSQYSHLPHFKSFQKHSPPII